MSGQQNLAQAHQAGGQWQVLLPNRAEWVNANPALAARWGQLIGYGGHVRLVDSGGAAAMSGANTPARPGQALTFTATFRTAGPITDPEALQALAAALELLPPGAELVELRAERQVVITTLPTQGSA